jgi:hypothetical protein
MGVALACGVLVTAVSIGQNAESDGGKEQAKTQAPSPAPSRGPYVALGDSYTAGPKIPDQMGKPAGCDRSSRNYPALVAKELGIRAADFRDVSCSGAAITHLTTPQSTDNGTNPPQLSALSATTKLVTLGVGGTDIGFSSMITTCVTAGVLFEMADDIGNISDKAPCEQRYFSDGEVAQKISATGDRLALTLDEIKRRAPQARVYVVGYPAILPAGPGADCDGDIPLAPGDVTFLHQKEQQLNAMLRERANAAGATYIDTFTPSLGHDACSPAATRWIEPLKPSSPAAVVHPNERGERGMATALLSVLKR